MTELSPRTRALLRAARRDLSPPRPAQERVWTGLVGAGVAPAASSAPPSMPPPAAGVGAAVTALGKPLAILVIAGAIAGGAWMAYRPGAEPSDAHRAARARAAAPRVIAATAIRPAAPSAPGDVVTPLHTPAPPIREPALAAGSPASVTPAPEDSFARELRLIRNATSALAHARPDAALRAVEAHARRYPDGVLREEREATRVIALCTLGRFDEASLAESRVRDDSPYAARIALACTPTSRDGSSEPR